VWKGLTVQNTLASYDMAKTTAVKSCIVEAPVELNTDKCTYL
jgi:hypothetical protein